MNVVQTEELTREQIEAQFIEKIRQDPTFRARLIKTPETIWLQELGNTDYSALTLRVFENTPNTFYLIAPTQDEALRQALSANPKAVWKRKFGTQDLQGITIRVIEELPGQFCFAIPVSLEDPLAIELGSEELAELSQQGVDLKNRSAQFSKNLRSLTQRRVPKTKLGRILLRLEGWLSLWFLSNPIVRSILRPIYWVRSLFFTWRRL